jgi:hypothetical protein
VHQVIGSILAWFCQKIGHEVIPFRSIFMVCCGYDLKIWSSHAGLFDVQLPGLMFMPIFIKVKQRHHRGLI